MSDGYVGLKDLAEWLKLTQRRVIQLVDEDVIPKAGRGKYPLRACVTNYIVYLRKQAEGTTSKSELTEEKLLTARVKRKRRELEYAEYEGRLIDIESHKAAMAEAFDFVRSNIRNLPGTLAPRLVGMDDARDIQRVLVAEVDEALRAIVTGAKRQIEENEGLPDDVPGRTRLISAGIETLDDLLDVENLTDLHGVGPVTAKKVRLWLEKYA